MREDVAMTDGIDEAAHARWARGYGRIRHQRATRDRVRGMAEHPGRGR